MYNVSELYKEAMHDWTQQGHLSGSVGGVAFTAADVLQASATLTNQCATSDDIVIGSVYNAVLHMTFCNKTLLNRGQWQGKQIILTWSQRLPGLVEYYEDIPVGVFTISEALHSAEGVVVTAYDNMTKFDKRMTYAGLSGTVYEMFVFTCEKCGVPFGMTQEQVEFMAGTARLNEYPDNDINTWRDVVYYLAQLCGAFATIGRDGSLVLRQFTQTPVMTIHSNERFASCQFADYRSFYTSVNIVNKIDGKVEHHRAAGITDDGLTMNLGANPFIQDSYAVRHQYCAWIIGAINNFDYVPFESSLLGNPAFDLGDVIEFVEGSAGLSSLSCICAYTFTFGHQCDLTGFGANPATQGAQSKTDKNISGIASQSQANKLTFVNYENVGEVEIGQEDELLIGQISFNSEAETNVEVNTKVTFDETLYKSVLASPTFSRSTYELVYKLNNIEVGRIPFGDTHIATDLHAEDTHTIEDYLSLYIAEPNVLQTLTVYLAYDAASLSDGVTLTGQGLDIPIGGIKITLKGQNLTSDEGWIGYFEYYDDIGRIENVAPIGAHQIEEDGVTFNIYEGEFYLVETFVEPLGAVPVGGVQVAEISEGFRIYLQALSAYWVDESGDYIVTENGEKILFTT
jgi:hypothetical protein